MELNIGDRFIRKGSFGYMDLGAQEFVLKEIRHYSGYGMGVVLTSACGYIQREMGETLFTELFTKVESAPKAFRPTEAQLKDIQNVCGPEKMKVVIDRTKRLYQLPKDQQALIFDIWLNDPESLLETDGRRDWGACNAFTLARTSMYKLKPEPLEVDWDIIDEKYNSAFMDKDGKVYLSEGIVRSFLGDFWSRSGRFILWPKCIKLEPYDSANWQFSVAVRPNK